MVQHTETIDIKKCLSLDLMLLSLAGLWAPAHVGAVGPAAAAAHHQRYRHLYTSYSIAALVFYFYMFIVSEIINIVVVYGDVERTVEASFLLLTHVAQAVKTFNALRWRSRIRNLLDQLNEPIFNVVDVRSVPCVLRSMNAARTNTVTFLLITLPTILLWAAFPLLEVERRLPLHGWYPFDTQQSPGYELAYVYQIVSTCVNAVCNLAHDTVAAGAMALMCGQLDVLSDKLADPRRGTTIIHLYTNDMALIPMVDNCKHLSQCVEHHTAIIEFLAETERLFSPGALAQFAVGCIIVCITAFKLSTMPISLEFFSAAFYMACMLNEILLYCYYGNEVMIKSMRLGDAVYASSWYEHSLRERRMLLINMERCKRPLTITAGSIFVLSLDTFTSILRSSYSFFAVLQQVTEE